MKGMYTTYNAYYRLFRSAESIFQEHAQDCPNVSAANDAAVQTLDDLIQQSTAIRQRSYSKVPTPEG